MIEKPSENEEEYFGRQEIERKRKLADERQAKVQVEERERAQALHFMKCPKCGGDLEEMEHHHVKVDQCTDCKGVWLDVGEIELLEHAHESGVTRFFSSMFGRRG